MVEKKNKLTGLKKGSVGAQKLFGVGTVEGPKIQYGNLKLPVFSNFRSTTIHKAFLLNAIAAAIIAVTAIEMKLLLDRKDVSSSVSIPVTILVTFASALFTYYLMWVLFNFGGGMIVGNDVVPIKLGKDKSSF